MISDSFNRRINYLRLAVTDRCNLRCTYCMPELGMRFEPRKELLTYEEMLRLMQISTGLGINKVRITGGEPFVRKDLMYFLKELAQVKGLDRIAITTNGLLIQPYIGELVQAGIKDINLSLDSVDPVNFQKITRREGLEQTLSVLEEMVVSGIRVKINTVVLPGRNTDELHLLALLAKQYPIDVRFIEEMPFNGSNKDSGGQLWNFSRIKEALLDHYPAMTPQRTEFSSTSRNFEVPGFQGSLGIIPAYTRTICGGCNRIRVTAVGRLKLCLYDNAGIDIKQILRNGASDKEVAEFLTNTIQLKPKDGFAAEKGYLNAGKPRESMSTIGG